MVTGLDSLACRVHWISVSVYPGSEFDTYQEVYV
jgi:hypothetical protein